MDEKKNWKKKKVNFKRSKYYIIVQSYIYAVFYCGLYTYYIFNKPGVRVNE